MGKRQHQKDKLYITSTEYTYLYGGRPPEADLQQQQMSRFRRLPYNYCCLSLQPFQHPYCDDKGYIFDLTNILPFLAKHKINPVDGKPMDLKALIKLNFAKNDEDQYQCPVLYKVFNEHTHIVAIKTTGNVFSYEAIEQLNIKPGNLRDLLTDEPFTKKDIITLQDPTNVEKQNAALFHHIVKKLKWGEDEDESAKSDPNYKFKNMNNVTRATLDELKNNSPTFFVPKLTVKAKPATPDRFNAATYSTGRAAAALTSTVMEPVSTVVAATIDDIDVIYSMVKKKGYVQVLTNFGPLNLELCCKDTPKTCHNFIQLCKKKYYDDTIFHRMIKNFMIQGGDPTGTGKGGESIFGEPFEDEFNAHLSHQGRGVLSMANSGPNTNKSQFFITLKSCRHLDKKHTIFGKVVGGLETLDKLEKIETDKDDKPKEPIKIISTTVFVDPFQEIEDELKEERAKDKEIEANNKKKQEQPVKIPETRGAGVGCLIKLDKIKYDDEGAGPNGSNQEQPAPGPSKKKIVTKPGFGDFKGW